MAFLTKSPASVQEVLLGALQIAPQYAPYVLPDLEISFFHESLQPTFAAISGFWDTQGRIDTTELCTRYQELKESLIGCVSACESECVRITQDQVERWAQLVKEQAALNRFQTLAMKSCDAGIAYSDLLTIYEQMGESLNLQTEKEDFKSLADGIDDYIRSLEEKPKYIRTGLSTVDAKLHLSQGNFVVIGGRPSAGKTALSLQIACYMAKAGKRVCYFSLETDPATLISRIIANQLYVPLQVVKNKKASPAELDRLADIKKAPLFIRSASGKSVGWMKAQALRMKADVVFVDYLQIIHQTGAKDRYTAITQTSIALHELAQTSGMLVIALAQLNRQAAQGAPSNADLKESGQIEQDCDAIILLSGDSDPYHFEVSKNKEGEVGRFPITFEKELQRFIEYRGT